MANPQKENGFVAISSELYDAMIRFRMSGELEQVLKAVIRKTYGYNKKEDSISNSQIVGMTCMKRQNVSRALLKLVKNRIVIKSDDKTGKGNVLKLNKDYEQWIPLVIKSDDKKKKKKVSSISLKPESKVMTTRIKSDDTLSSEVMNTIDNRQLKDNIQKTSKTSKEFLQGNQWNELIDPFQRINPMWRKFYSSKTERGALQDLVKEMGFEKVKWLVEHLKEAVSKPYAPKITKPSELKRDIGKLVIYWEQEKQKNIKNKTTVGKL